MLIIRCLAWWRKISLQLINVPRQILHPRHKVHEIQVECLKNTNNGAVALFAFAFYRLMKIIMQYFQLRFKSHKALENLQPNLESTPPSCAAAPRYVEESVRGQMAESCDPGHKFEKIRTHKILLVCPRMVGETRNSHPGFQLLSLSNEKRKEFNRIPSCCRGTGNSACHLATGKRKHLEGSQQTLSTWLSNKLLLLSLLWFFFFKKRQ